MTQYVLYHANCFDGFGAAWAAHKALGDDATYIACTHGKPVPDIPDDSDVLIFDFSYEREKIEELASRTNLQVFDHHTTAEYRLAGLDYAYFDMDRSGAMLAWDYFFPGREPPDLLKWIQDRDLWRWEYEESKRATAALDLYPFDFDVWDRLMANPAEVLAAGEVALTIDQNQIARLCENAYIGVVDGHEVPIVNATSHWSGLGNKLCQLYPDHPFSASWYRRSDGTRKWSLRSIGEFNVAEIAAKHGGGGHKNAAGFVTP